MNDLTTYIDVTASLAALRATPGHVSYAYQAPVERPVIAALEPEARMAPTNTVYREPYYLRAVRRTWTW